MTTARPDHVQQSIDAYWSDRAEAYDAYQQQGDRLELDRAAWARIWTDALPEPPSRVLDLGTGSGYVALLLAGLGHDVTGLDGAEGMLRRARAHAAAQTDPPRFVLGDAVDPALPDGSFDAVTSRYLMWTLREPERALARWRRLLRPGGRLAVVDAPWFPDGATFGHGGDFARRYDDRVRAALPLATAASVEPLRAMVASAGFRDVTVRPLTSIWELDRTYGVAPDHEVRLQFLVSGLA